MLESIVSLQAACSFSLGLGEDSINASSVLVMPMVSSRMTGFRGTGFDRAKYFPLRNTGGGNILMFEDDTIIQETSILLSDNRG